MNVIADLLKVDSDVDAFRRRRGSYVANALGKLGIDHPVVHSQQLVDFSLAAEAAHHVRENLPTANGPDEARLLVQQSREFLDRTSQDLRSFAGAGAVACSGLEEDECMLEPGATVTPLSQQEDELLRSAVVVLDGAGVSDCFAHNVGLTVVLGVAAVGAPVATWATGAFPYTVHLHLMPRAELIARDLIHEATHNFLNDWLASREIALEAKTPLFWSPWKDSDRPLFGFVHSIVAFSVVTVFLSRLLDEKGATDREWLRSFRDAELVRLKECQKSVQSAVEMLPDELGPRVRHVYDAALAG